MGTTERDEHRLARILNHMHGCNRHGGTAPVQGNNVHDTKYPKPVQWNRTSGKSM